MTSARDRPRRAGPALLAVVGALLIALLAYGVLRQAPDSTIDDTLAAGRPIGARSFQLDVLDRGRDLGALRTRLAGPLGDRRLGIAELRGIPVVLNFWASWCDPCREEAPRLERAWRQQARPAGVLVLGLSMQDVSSDARAFLREFDVTYPNIRDPTNDTARRYGVSGLPETFFITADGQIVGHVIGVIGARQLSDGINAARRGEILGARSGGDSRPTR